MGTQAREETGSLGVLLGWLRSGTLPQSLDGDGDSLAEAATAQGLAGWLHAEATRQQVDWPAAVVQRLRRRHLADLCGVAQQLDVVAAVHRRLLDAGLRSLPLKGAALAETCYGAGERPMGDVDLLVLERFPAALETLVAEGWRVEEAADHAVSLRSPLTPVLLELHRSAASCPGLHRLDAEGLWQRSRRGSGQLPRLPAPEDLLVLLSLHAAFQHALGLRLVQYLDLRRLLQAHQLDVALVLELALQAGAEGSVALTLQATQLLIGPLHPELETAFAPHLPGDLARWLGGRAGFPLELLRPAPRDLVRVRWGLARGRRARLLLETARGASGGWRRELLRGLRLGRRLLEPRPGQAP